MIGDNYLSSLAVDIRSAHAVVGDSAKLMAERALEAGRLLNEAKEKLGHGEFLPWLKDAVGIPERTARRYMALAKSGIKSATVADLGLVGALKHYADISMVPLPGPGEVVFGYDSSKRYLFIWHEPRHSGAEYLLYSCLDCNGDGAIIDTMYRGILRDYLHKGLVYADWSFDYSIAKYVILPYSEHASFLESIRDDAWKAEMASWRKVRA